MAVAALAGRGTAYPIRGSLSGVMERRDRNGKPYLSGTLEFTTKAGRESSVRAYAFGRAMVLVGRRFANGPTRLYGTFRDGAFHAIQEAMDPRPTATGATTGMVVRDAGWFGEETKPDRGAIAGDGGGGTMATRAAPAGGVVGGHWKMQAHGPGRALRKALWVRAYGRGDAGMHGPSGGPNPVGPGTRDEPMGTAPWI